MLFAAAYDAYAAFDMLDIDMMLLRYAYSAGESTCHKMLPLCC